MPQGTAATHPLTTPSHIIQSHPLSNVPSHHTPSIQTSTGYDFEHINKKRTGEQMSAHAQKYCELLIHHVPGEDDEWGDRSLLTFSGWIDSDAGGRLIDR